MASTESKFQIGENDRKTYEQSVNDSNQEEGEREMRDAIVKWAAKKKPGEVDWIYTWNPQ